MRHLYEEGEKYNRQWTPPHAECAEEDSAFFVGAALEEAFLGTCGEMTFNYYRNVLSRLVDLSNNDAAGLASVFERRSNGTVVMREKSALKLVLGIPFKKLQFPAVKAKMAKPASQIAEKLLERNSLFTFCVTTNTPLDFDYGADAIIYMSDNSLAAKNAVAYGKSPLCFSWCYHGTQDSARKIISTYWKSAF